MNREIMGRKMFQNGGVAMPAAPGPQAMPPQAMPPRAMSPEQMNQMSQGEVNQTLSQYGVDPAILEQMMGAVAQQTDQLDQAQDFEEVINAMRETDAPLSARYKELAALVGEEDAKQTPESVLALVQPVIMMAGVDQGIGSLAAEEMNTPVEGDMAGGIMSTVNMGPPEEPPVNFNKGGLVRQGMNQPVQYFADDNVNRVAGAIPAGRLGELYGQQRDVFRSLIDQGSRTEDLQKQKDLTEAQMLFDIAQGALAFASGGGKPRGSPAEQLAASFSPVLGNIGNRAAELEKYRQAQKKEDRALDLAALQGAQTLYAAEQASELKSLDNIFDISYTDKTGNLVRRRGPLSQREYGELIANYPDANVVSVPKQTTPQKAENFLDPKTGTIVSAVPGTPYYNQLVARGATVVGELPASAAVDTEQFTAAVPITVMNPNGTKTTISEGNPVRLTPLQVQSVMAEFGPNALRSFDAPLSDRDYFNKYGMNKEEFNNLDPEVRGILQKTSSAANVELINMSGTLIAYDKITGDRKVVHQISTKKIIPVNGQLLLVDPEKPEDGARVLFGGGDDAAEGDYRIIKDIKTDVETYVDISTPSGRAAVALASAENAKAGRNLFEVLRVPTDQRISATPYNVPDGKGGMKVVLSYDGGRTYVDTQGVKQPIPTENATRLSDTIANDALTKQRIQNEAGEELRKIDENFVAPTLRSGDRNNPKNLSSEEGRLVRDAMAAARNGTGPYAGFIAFLDNVFGGAIPAARKAFQDTQANRQFLRGVTILGRSALVVNPRFPVAELEKVGELFPDPDKFLRNPETEANKYIELKNLALRQKERNLRELAGGRQPPEIVAQIFSNNYEIDRLLSLLSVVPSSVDSGNKGVSQALGEYMRRNRQGK